MNSQRQQSLLEVERQRSRLEQERSELQRRQKEAVNRRERQAGVQLILQDASKECASLQDQMAEEDGYQKRLGELQSALGAIRGEQPRLKKEMQKMKARQVQLQSEESGRCPLCDQELTLDHRAAVIAQVEEEGTVLGNRYRTNESELTHLQTALKETQADLDALKNVERQLRIAQRNETTARTQLTDIEKALADWKGNGVPRLEAITRQLAEEDFSPEAQTRLSELEASLDSLEYDPQAHASTRQRVDSLADAQEAHRRLGEARAALKPLVKSLEDLAQQISEQTAQVKTLSQQHADARAAMERLGPAPDIGLVEAERELNQLREAEVLASKTVGAAEQALQALDRIRELREQLTGTRKEKAQATRRLKTLERAFGRNGVQALLIEHALPAIQENANDLLDRLTGGEMRVSFTTQRQLKTRDAMVETLDIHIADDAGERPYEMYSGGEAFRVNFAIRIALSQLLTQRTGARLQTLVIDEGFGSQDPEGRQRLIEAINTIQPDFAKIWVITHIEELRDAFPVRIQVTKGPEGSRITVT